LEKDTFVSLTELEKLVVFKCGLRTIQLGAFNGHTKLTGLSLILNEIRAIISGPFETLKRQENLDNYNNTIEHVDSAVFSGLVNLKA
jgi:Leucine-rich repeat (LRR) protein